MHRQVAAATAADAADAAAYLVCMRYWNSNVPAVVFPAVYSPAAHVAFSTHWWSSSVADVPRTR